MIYLIYFIDLIFFFKKKEKKSYSLKKKECERELSGETNDILRESKARRIG